MNYVEKCCAKTCLNTTLNSNISFFPFPKDKNLREIWMKAIQIENWSSKKTNLICSHHFKPTDFYKNLLGPNVKTDKVLKPNAVPSIFDIIYISDNDENLINYISALPVNNQISNIIRSSLACDKKIKRYCFIEDCEYKCKIYFNFPGNRNLRQEWYRILNISLNLDDKSYKNYKICESHLLSYNLPRNFNLSKEKDKSNCNEKTKVPGIKTYSKCTPFIENDVRNIDVSKEVTTKGTEFSTNEDLSFYPAISKVCRVCLKTDNINEIKEEYFPSQQFYTLFLSWILPKKYRGIYSLADISDENNVKLCNSCLSHIPIICSFYENCMRSKIIFENFFNDINEPIITNKKTEVVSTSSSTIENDEIMDTSNNVPDILIDKIEEIVPIKSNNSEKIIKDSYVSLNLSSENDKVLSNLKPESTDALSNSKSYTSRISKNFLEKMSGKQKVEYNGVKVLIKRAFNCKYCKKLFPNKSTLNQHLIRHENSEIIPQTLPVQSASLVNISSKIKEIKCKHCHITFKEKKDYLMHGRKMHWNSRLVTCPTCLKSMPYKLYIVHKAFHDNSIKIPKSTGKTTVQKEKCKYCKKEFASKEELKEHHESAHSQNRLVLCPICFKPVKHISLTRHIHVHKFKILCDICGVFFNDKSALLNHRTVVHFKLKRFQCTECEMKFATPYKLKIHQNSVHYKKQICTCEICGISFSHRDSLRNHQKYNRCGKTKRFNSPIEQECPECKIMCNSKRELMKHRQFAHNIKGKIKK